MPEHVRIPDPALVVLVGASGSGKTTWARERYRPSEIVSSDELRAIIGTGPHDLDASTDAFAVLNQIVASRVRRGLTTVVDTLGLDAGRRRGYLDLARTAGLPAAVVLVDTPPRLTRQRNAARDRRVPASALDGQLRTMRAVAEQIATEGWDVIVRADAESTPEPEHLQGTREAAHHQQRAPAQLGFVLQISRFPWGDDPSGWLGSIATAASDTGFEGVALMDHLIQVPQVDRAWEPIAEPWVTLGMLAGLDTPLRLGPLVTPITFHAAGVWAKMVATLDGLSAGRAFCGIGAGWWAREHAAYGLPFPPARDRLDRLETAIETMRVLWASGTKAYQGRRVSLPETTCYPRPVSSIPIIVGGSGERRTLRIAAAYGDACNLRSDTDTLEAKIAVLRRHCQEVGRDPDEVAITVLDVPVIGDDREDVAIRVERLRDRTSATTYANRHHAGTVADQIGRYRLLAEHGVSTVFVSIPDLAGPDDVSRLAAIPAAFR
jgi:alkanesulfonate monooxygenase SsuD/methylene tetrahydromethanopterin reductase-like flavin-dependent oxidoreductase (luciferase family)/predicted kinase